MEIITRTSSDWPDDAPVEIVERKGLGHPDTLCDAIAERVCTALCRAYRERFGTILHHNVDKVLLCGGASRPRFGGGTIIQPIEIYLGGRATAQWRGVSVPVDELAIAASREVLAEQLPLHPEARIVSRIRPGSSDLTALFTRSGIADDGTEADVPLEAVRVGGRLRVRPGFRGPIWCTDGTRDLLRILLPDSGHLQEEDARHANQYGYAHHRPALPLYTRDDAERCLTQLRPVVFHQVFEPARGVTASYSRAGHILGSGRTIIDYPMPNAR